MKKVYLKTGWLYHPVSIFLAIQVLWILLMVAWIRWYIEKHTQLRAMAQRLRTQVEVEGWGWLPLVEGAILLTLILAGATVIFIYYVKQRRLNQIQRAFVSNVTHELKSPVASIQLALETMALRDLSNDRRREFVSMMLDDTERLLTLIDRILGAARIEKRPGRYQLEPVSMRHFVEEVLEEDRRLYEKDGQKIILEKGRDAWVAIDRSAMRAVLANLVENASRYSPKNSTIRLRLYRDLRSCRLDVVDSGNGIPGKDLRNVFKMFWRGSDELVSRVRGTGLGLYIVRNIVKDHRGEGLGVKPGDRSRLDFQRAAAANTKILESCITRQERRRSTSSGQIERAAGTARRRADTMDSKNQSRILLVEDELNLARSLQFNLEQEGYHVQSTPSGKEALRLHDRESFDLIILDLMIEEIDGFEVARQLRQRDQKLPIIMLTARSAVEDRIHGLELGADDYMIKPFHLGELLLKVERMLKRAEWYGANNPPPCEVSIDEYRVNLEKLSGSGPRGRLQLTTLEADLLKTLTSQPNHVFSRGELLEKVWGYHSEVETRTVDNFIVRLRKYFEEEPEQPRHFISLRGRGYMYVP